MARHRLTKTKLSDTCMKRIDQVHSKGVAQSHPKCHGADHSLFDFQLSVYKVIEYFMQLFNAACLITYLRLLIEEVCIFPCSPNELHSQKSGIHKNSQC